MIDREAIFTALFARAAEIAWGEPPQAFAYLSRRVRLADDLPALPALCQAEHAETLAQVSGQPHRRTLAAAWMVHHATSDPDAIPAVTNNLILDAIEAVLAADDASGCCTLGGIVHHCWIEGEVFKDPGDLDGQALLIVPIRMLVP